ncbi:MAG: PEP-CTERM sorting domain-containing protein, partial [Acidobacteriota bacterium]|nr:PEP-CTERM sorting domain-containing protein [Acidobacteriota bacterium]
QGQAGGTDTVQFDWVNGANGLPGWGMGAQIDQVISESITPEPATLILVGLGLVAVAGVRRRKNR